jgi:ABC-type transport system involved in multi-copper enzyme maturation permease subunit
VAVCFLSFLSFHILRKNKQSHSITRSFFILFNIAYPSIRNFVVQFLNYQNGLMGMMGKQNPTKWKKQKNAWIQFR